MGVLQNLKLWENNVTFIDENGEVVTKKMPRVAPPAPWKVVGLLTLENWIFFIVGL
jgi:SHS family lactate transporter-like MFS transporter